MKYRTGTEDTEERATLRLVDHEGEDVWEPDPALDAADIETLDELAELFIGEQGVFRADTGHGRGSAQDSSLSCESSLPQAARILEGVITGHLPVRGAVWVRAYAASVASHEGAPVVLVRVTPERTSVELVGTSAQSDPVVDIATAIHAAGCTTGHWLLHFDELDQASVLQTGMLDRVTVLSGADEPAIVSAYRLIKAMAERSVAETGEVSEQIGVAIVGSDPANTTRATGRLVDATRQFLDLALDVRPGVPRVQSAPVAMLGESDRRFEPTEVLSMIVGRAHERAPIAAEAPVPEISAGLPASDAGSVDLPDPSSLVIDLKPTGLPCPIADGVEIATDDAGRLHLLSWWSPEALGELLKASVWARVNLPVLIKACPALHSEPAAPTQHVLCTDLSVAADLRGADTVVHLAQPGDRVTPSGWVCGRVS